MLWTLRSEGGGVLQHLVTMEGTKMNEKQFDQVLSDGARACAMLEGMIRPSQLVVPKNDLCDVIGKLKLLAVNASLSEADKMLKALELAGDACDAITADYQDIASGLHAKLEQYK